MTERSPVFSFNDPPSPEERCAEFLDAAREAIKALAILRRARRNVLPLSIEPSPELFKIEIALARAAGDLKEAAEALAPADSPIPRAEVALGITRTMQLLIAGKRVARRLLLVAESREKALEAARDYVESTKRAMELAARQGTSQSGGPNTVPPRPKAGAGAAEPFGLKPRGSLGPRVPAGGGRARGAGHQVGLFADRPPRS